MYADNILCNVKVTFAVRLGYSWLGNIRLCYWLASSFVLRTNPNARRGFGHNSGDEDKQLCIVTIEEPKRFRFFSDLYDVPVGVKGNGSVEATRVGAV